MRARVLTALLVLGLGASACSDDGGGVVVGKGTENGGSLDVSVRVVGVVSEDGSIAAEARSHVVGTAEQQPVDCRGKFEVTGQRR